MKKKYPSSFFNDLKNNLYYLNSEGDIQTYISEFTNNPKINSTAFITDNPIELTYRVPFFRLLYVLKGSIGISIDQKELDFYEGGIILANPNTHIIYRGTETNTIVATIILKNSFFNNLFLSNLIEIPLFYNFFMKGLDSDYQKNNYFFFQQNLEDFTHYLLLYLFKEAFINCENKTTRHPSLFLLLSELNDNMHTSLVLEKSTLPSSLFIGEILNRINRQYDSISLNELASLYKMHPNSLSSMIKKQTGKNFSEHLTEVRLNKASNLLLKSNITVQEISEILGYQDKSYFFRVFKKYFGMSPRQYRNHLRSFKQE